MNFVPSFFMGKIFSIGVKKACYKFQKNFCAVNSKSWYFQNPHFFPFFLVFASMDQKIVGSESKMVKNVLFLNVCGLRSLKDFFVKISKSHKKWLDYMLFQTYHLRVPWGGPKAKNYPGVIFGSRLEALTRKVRICNFRFNMVVWILVGLLKRNIMFSTKQTLDHAIMCVLSAWQMTMQWSKLTFSSYNPPLNLSTKYSLDFRIIQKSLISFPQCNFFCYQNAYL